MPNVKSMSKEECRWMAENDLRTLIDAGAINKDAKRLKAAQALAKTKLLDLAGLASEGPKD